MSSLPRARPPEDRFIHALYDYRHPLVKRVIWKLKYKNAKDVAECFADSLLEEIIAVLDEELLVFESEKPLIIPIPLHKKRLRERGYNQSDLIAKAVVAQGEQKIFDISTTILRRVKETKSQVRSEKRTVRIKNLENSFICDTPSLVRGRTIILIDDVTTTGATISSAKKALIRANPKKILAFTIAH
ncbi:MAG: phosphoribosyltransferase family protein [Patescibacteria group bacterium]